MSVSSIQESNEAIRIPVTIAVEAEEMGKKYFLFTQNISMSGMLLESDELLPDSIGRIGNRIELAFYLSSEEGGEVNTYARVVRCTEKEVAKDKNVHELAVAFDDMESDDSHRLRLFITEYALQIEEKVEDEWALSPEEATDPEITLGDDTLSVEDIRAAEDEEETRIRPIEPEALPDDDRADELEGQEEATHFEQLPSSDQMSDAERAYSEAVQSSWADIGEDENTPRGVFRAYPLSKYRMLYLDRDGLDDDEDKRIKTLVEAKVGKLEDEERVLLKRLLKNEDPSFTDKVMVRLIFWRLKLLIELEAFHNYAVEVGSLNESDSYGVSKYLNILNVEANKSNEAANLLGQALVADGDWESFTVLNRLRGAVERVIHDFNEEVHLRILPAESEHEAVVSELLLEECLDELQDIIPDPDEERDDFPQGATGEDIREFWDAIFGIPDEEIQRVMMRALAVRKKVRHDFYQARDLGDRLMDHRLEVTDLFRKDARLVKETVSELSALKERNVDDALLANIIRVLEGLSYRFGYVVRTIPKEFLDSQQIESVRYKRSSFRQQRQDRLAQLRKITEKHGLQIMTGVMLVLALGTLIYRYMDSRALQVDARMAGRLYIANAYKVSNRCLYLVVSDDEWNTFTVEDQKREIERLIRLADDESVSRFQVTSPKGALLAASVVDEKGEVIAFGVTPNRRFLEIGK